MALFHVKLNEGPHRKPEFEVSCDFEADALNREEAESIINETMQRLFSIKHGITYPSQKTKS